MAFENGGKLWQLRSKSGVDALFSNPEDLWKAAVEYFESVDKRKITKKDWVGQAATEVKREFDVPYTITGLCVYLGCGFSWWRQFKDTKTFKDNPVFGTVYHRIEDIVYTQKFEGAAAGIFNAQIISRDLGLRDNVAVGNIPNETFNITLKIE